MSVHRRQAYRDLEGIVPNIYSDVWITAYGAGLLKWMLMSEPLRDLGLLRLWGGGGFLRGAESLYGLEVSA